MRKMVFKISLIKNKFRKNIYFRKIFNEKVVEKIWKFTQISEKIHKRIKNKQFYFCFSKTKNKSYLKS